MNALVRTGFVGSVIALVAASACCVMLLGLAAAGLGGAWLALLSPVVAASPYVLGISYLLLVAAWFVALRRGAGRRTVATLTGGSALAAIAWLIMINGEWLTLYL